MIKQHQKRTRKTAKYAILRNAVCTCQNRLEEKHARWECKHTIFLDPPLAIKGLIESSSNNPLEALS
jgi:hypothetical protein